MAMIESARSTFNDSEPEPTVDVPGRYEFSQAFALGRPGPYLVGVEVRQYTYTMGAHGNDTHSRYLIDLRTGDRESVNAVFRDDIDGRTQLTDIVHERLQREHPKETRVYGDRQQVGEMLAKLDNYFFGTGSMTLDMGW